MLFYTGPTSEPYEVEKKNAQLSRQREPVVGNFIVFLYVVHGDAIVDGVYGALENNLC